MKVLVAQSSPTLQSHILYLARLLCPWNSPGKNTRLGSHSLLQGIFLTQGWNLGLLHHRQILYHLSHQGIKSNESLKVEENAYIWLIHFVVQKKLAALKSNYTPMKINQVINYF